MEKYALSIFLYQRKHLKKFLNIMRISTLLLFVCIFASYASDLSSADRKSKYCKHSYDDRRLYQIRIERKLVICLFIIKGRLTQTERFL